MNSFRKFLPAALLVVSGCATSGELVNTQRDMDEVKNRVLKVEKKIGDIGAETREGVEKSVKGFQKDLDAMRRNDADLQASLEGIRVDLQVMAGKVDDVGTAAKKPSDDLALLKEDLDRRLAAFDEKVTKLGREIEELKKKGAEAPPIPAGPDQLYQGALQTLRGGDTAKGREMFQKFLDQYPKHDLAANARYWIGESWFEEKKYDQAVLEFQEVIKNYPGKEKSASAMLKQGMAFVELGDTKAARYVYKKLAAEYPLSDEAKKAQEKLKELK